MSRRRFLNLVVHEYGSRIYSLCRIDPSKHLFYPSGAAAAHEAAESAPSSEAKASPKKTQKKRGSGGGSAMAATTAAETTFCNRPPRAEINFQESPTLGMASAWATVSRGRDSSRPSYYMFAPLLGDGGGAESGSTAEDLVLFADTSGHTVVYDAGTKSVVTMPSSSIRVGVETTTLSTTSSAGESCLYVMDLAPDYWSKSNPEACACRFEALVYRRDDIAHPPVMPYHDRIGWRWYRRALQPPPFLTDPEYRRSNKMPAYAVVDGGATICVSSGTEVLGTYAFDTAEWEWRHAGKWLLPFAGRAELVPELGLWFGLSASSPHGSLCALDLTSVTADMADAERSPTLLRHSWDVDLGLPEGFIGWPPFEEHLVNLGAGRFCVARCFEPAKRKKTDPEITVLTGVEVSRCEDDGAEDALRMIKHRSMVYRLQNHSIKHVF